MIYIFVPYYNQPDEKFCECLARQTVDYKLLKYDRRANKDYWSHACNVFYHEMRRYRGIEPNDVVCIMNSDITFSDTLIEEGSTVNSGEILIPRGCGIEINWQRKKFFRGSRIDTIPGRCFFMRMGDFLNSGGFSRLLPHYLSDYDFGIRMKRKGMKINLMNQPIYHKKHSLNTRTFSVLNPKNPVFWMIFLLKHGRNRYFFINLLKIWMI